jgi:hypothetical protein
VKLRSLIFVTLLAPGLPAALLADVTLTTDKPVYQLGDLVVITAHNNGPEDLEFLSNPVFQIWNSDLEQCLFGCGGLPVVEPFPAGATVGMSWDTSGDPVGNYGVGLALFDGPSVTYILENVVADEPQSWGAIKALYR